MALPKPERILGQYKPAKSLPISIPAELALVILWILDSLQYLLAHLIPHRYPTLIPFHDNPLEAGIATGWLAKAWRV
jgi:hypothetical protein